MSFRNLKPLVIGDIEFKIPIVQGGMGVKISTASLVSSVSNYGALGTLSSIALGYGTPENESNYLKASIDGLVAEIKHTKSLTSKPFACNILVAVSNYEDLVITSCKEKVDFIVSGAGLPLRLPELTASYDTKLIPIVSSAKAFELIVRKWKKSYNKLPDAVIVEGPLAGGHLGFHLDELLNNSTKSLYQITSEVIKLADEIELLYGKKIPVIAGGGVFDGKDIAKFLKLGASGVQIATRFVVTDECAASDNFKDLYISATENDIAFIKSPVGMPGRVIKTKLSEYVKNGDRTNFKCHYHCLRTCNPKTAEICIAQAMFNAYLGNIDEAIVFAGQNAHRINKRTNVNYLLDSLVEETLIELTNSLEQTNTTYSR